MAKAGRALRQVLETYDIPQNQLAVAMNVTRSSIHRWIYELSDPAGDAVLDIRKGLQIINPAAAAEFTRLYWGEDELGD